MKSKSIFSCKECGAVFPKWGGKCSYCGNWDTIEETKPENSGIPSSSSASTEPVLLSQLENDLPEIRISTGAVQVDRVLGGGFVSSSVGVLGGEPGIGKSTLILQLLARLSRNGSSVLYISGEESIGQIKSRADRLELRENNLTLYTETCLEDILYTLSKGKYDFVVIDSIQTIYSREMPHAPGSLIQVRETTLKLIKYAKSNGPAIMLIGHVTKDGALAGPKTLEHMVDYVLQLESDDEGVLRYLQSTKNRFGAVGEVGIFKFTDKGLVEVDNPAKIMRKINSSISPGVTNYLTREGSRIFSVEVQALVSDNVRNMATRQCRGIDRNRYLMLIAAIEKHMNLNFAGLDMYLNVAGGWKNLDSDGDLAVVAAILGSYRKRALSKPAVFIGELSLAGILSLRYDAIEKAGEASKLGFTDCVLPLNSITKKNFKGDIMFHSAENLHQFSTVYDSLLEGVNV